jgi:hypothetical protein
VPPLRAPQSACGNTVGVGSALTRLGHETSRHATLRGVASFGALRASGCLALASEESGGTFNTAEQLFVGGNFAVIADSAIDLRSLRFVNLAQRAAYAGGAVVFRLVLAGWTADAIRHAVEILVATGLADVAVLGAIHWRELACSTVATLVGYVTIGFAHRAIDTGSPGNVGGFANSGGSPAGHLFGDVGVDLSIDVDSAAGRL